MKKYLLTWNPARYAWSEIAEDIEKVRTLRGMITRWSCGGTKSIEIGDRAFLMKLGEPPRGIVGSGTVTRGSFEDRHWVKEKARAGLSAQYIDVNVNTLLNPYEDEILPTELLDRQLRGMYWHPQASGVRIPDEIAEQLEMLWAAFLRNQVSRLPEELDEAQLLPGPIYEGAVREISVNAYERDAEARRRCIAHYGARCSICGLDFEEMYGLIGTGFIHVHHLVPISEIGEQYQVDPIYHLRPVCPNCHAMLHRRNPSYSIGEMIKILESATKVNR